MNLSKNGTDTLINNCVTAITALGFYILLEGKEYFISFSDYPEFRKAGVNDIFTIKTLSPGQIRWETLDIDIEIDSLEQPDRFPLIFKE